MSARKASAIVGVAEHGNSAVLVTLGPDGSLIDRRRVDLTRGLPTHPYHHEGSWAVGRYTNSAWAHKTTLPEAIALVEKVTAAATRGAKEILAALDNEVSVPVSGIGVRICQKLPPTIEARIRDTKAATVADSIMYRMALASAAEARGWHVTWYERERVAREAKAALGGKDLEAFLRAMGKAAGPPWQAMHKLAAMAALAAAKTA